MKLKSDDKVLVALRQAAANWAAASRLPVVGDDSAFKPFDRALLRAALAYARKVNGS